MLTESLLLLGHLANHEVQNATILVIAKFHVRVKACLHSEALVQVHLCVGVWSVGVVSVHTVSDPQQQHH